MLRLHMRKTLPFVPPLRVIRRAAWALERAYIILVKAKKPLDLLTAVMEIGSQVLIEFRAGVGLSLLPKRHGSVEAALDTLQIGLLHSEQLGVDGGGNFGG